MNSNTRIKFGAALLSCLATTTLLPLSASADAAGDPPPSVVVSYAGLDVYKPAGAKILYRRIERAARDVCHLQIVTNRPLLGVERACIARAVDDAVKSVDSPALARLHANSPARLASR